MKNTLLVLLFFGFISAFGQGKQLPATPPGNFTKVLSQLLLESSNDFKNVIGDEKSIESESDLKQFESKSCLPLASACFLEEGVNDDFDVFHVFNAEYGYFKDKSQATKAFGTLVSYIKNDSALKKILEAEPLDESDDEMAQLFVFKNNQGGTTLCNIILESTEAYDQILEEDIVIWKLYLTIGEDFSN